MSGYTKGRVEADGNGVHLLNGQCVALTHMEPKERRVADARLIAEAFNVADETGRTPRQLADERAALMASCVRCLQRMMNAKTDDSIDEQRQLFRDNLFDLAGAIGEIDINEEFLNKYLAGELDHKGQAKVKGPVQS